MTQSLVADTLLRMEAETPDMNLRVYTYAGDFVLREWRLARIEGVIAGVEGIRLFGETGRQTAEKTAMAIDCITGVAAVKASGGEKLMKKIGLRWSNR